MKNTKLYRELQKRESGYLKQVDHVYKYAEDMLPKINRIFANYTGHGIEHSINVMNYMYDLVTDISQISDLEIACLIDAALLHDIGMTVGEDEIALIKRDEFNYHGRKYSVICQKYQDEITALQECVRPVHGERAFAHIMEMKKEFFVIPDYTNCNFQEELAKICQAHTMNREWLLQNLDDSQVKGSDWLNAQYIAMLLRIADYLDMDEKRAPIELYRFLAPVGFGDEEWRQHYIIGNREKVKRDDTSGIGVIEIYGECDDAKIHRKFLRYLSGISEELLWCTGYTGKHMKEKYRIFLQPQIDNRIKTKGFEISDLRLQMDYQAVMALLMGENVYGDKKYGLRELVQNAVDACRVMAEEAEHLEKYRYVPYVPMIQVILDVKTEKMIVLDNGIGMGVDVLTKYFLNIGKSYYRSDEFLYQGKDYCPIGTFGIGFLACFMLSDSVVVETKHYAEQQGFTIELEKDSEYVCKKDRVHFIGESGTAIILDLKSVMEAFDGEEGIRKYLERTFLNQEVPIRLLAIDGTRREGALNLKEFEALNPSGIKLDSYLKDISVLWEFRFDKIKVSKKFSELCTDEWSKNERVFAEYDFNKRKLCLKDTEGEELKKYIADDRIAVLKIQGIKKEEKELYVEWKKWENIIPPDSILKTIYFPVKYDKSLSVYKKGGHSDSSSGAVWYGIGMRAVKAVYGNINIHSILCEYGLLMEWVEIELGIFPIISVGGSRYMEYNERWVSSYTEENETYWHGIRLDKGKMNPGIKIIGTDCGKCVINIFRKDIFPNVARDSLESDTAKKVRMAVEKAAHQYMADNLADDREMQTALQTYIDKEYPGDNPYYKG